MRLTKTQRYALAGLAADRWRGAAESGVMGNTIEALERRGLVESVYVRRGENDPATGRRAIYDRIIARLTPAGAEELSEISAENRNLSQEWGR